MKSIIKILLIIVILISCNRTIPCNKNEIIPVFIGYSSGNLDTVILKKFKKGDNFTQLIDSSIFVRDGVDSNRFYTFSDTTIIDFNTLCCTRENLIPDFDWQLVLTYKKDTILISDIESPQTESSCFKCSCLNPINSVVQNGQKIFPVPYQYIRYYSSSGYVSYSKSGYAIFINN
jgi:hypothetical protein